jgi:hypothetical protein
MLLLHSTLRHRFFQMPVFFGLLLFLLCIGIGLPELRTPSSIEDCVGALEPTTARLRCISPRLRGHGTSDLALYHGSCICIYIFTYICFTFGNTKPMKRIYIFTYICFTFGNAKPMLSLLLSSIPSALDTCNFDVVYTILYGCANGRVQLGLAQMYK